MLFALDANTLYRAAFCVVSCKGVVIKTSPRQARFLKTEIKLLLCSCNAIFAYRIRLWNQMARIKVNLSTGDLDTKHTAWTVIYLGAPVSLLSLSILQSREIYLLCSLLPFSLSNLFECILVRFRCSF